MSSPATDSTRVPGPQRKRLDGKRGKEICDAAAELFFTKGYEVTTTQDIAEAVGMLKGSLYYYIDSKEDIFYEIVMSGSGNFSLAVVDSMDVSSMDRIRIFVASCVRAACQQLVEGALYYRHSRSLSAERQEAINATAGVYEKALSRYIRAAQLDGLVRNDLDVEVTVHSIMAMANSLHTWYSRDSDWTEDDITASQCDFVVAGLATAAGRRRLTPLSKLEQDLRESSAHFNGSAKKA